MDTPANAAARSAPRRAGRQRALWLLGASIDTLAGALPVLREVRARFPRLRLVCTPRAPGVDTWLAAQAPEIEITAPAPTALRRAATALRDASVRLIVLLDQPAAADAALLRAARQRRIPVVHLTAAADGDGGGAAAGIERIDRRAADAAERLAAWLRLDLKALRSEERGLRRLAERLAMALVDHAATRRLVRRVVERIDSLETLAARLGHPRTILCLGNGPSSEDPALRDVAYDALFRVNHLWLDRGLHCEPAVVFTGAAETARRVPGAMLGISHVRHEARLVLAGLTRPGPRPLRFFTAERLGILPPRAEWGDAVPTNGAYMLAAAVALRPARLIVAGVDLFRHAAGAYPGDARTPNAYTPRHAAALDEAVILATLRAHTGELVIIGEILQARWAGEQRALPL